LDRETGVQKHQLPKPSTNTRNTHIFISTSIIQQNTFNLDADTPEILILLQLGMVLNKVFIATYSEGKPLTRLMIVEKARYFYDAMKIIDKW
jgi:hypothetical protein